MPNATTNATTAPKREGLALCLSGGGYRAMVFHLGALWRLNEAGLLPKLARVTSVSGGSITAGALGVLWGELDFDPATGVARRFDLVRDAVRHMARQDVDAGAVGWGIALPGTISDRIVKAYEKHLFGDRTLQALPDSAAGHPRFIILATNVQTGALWRFERKQMGDYRVGLVPNPTVSVARAVGASSAFPPVLSPSDLSVSGAYDPSPGADLQRPPFTDKVVLSDGGVYDNLGLEPATKRCATVLVSDGGQKMTPEEKPARDWARHAVRVLELVDNQVRSLRKRHLIDAYERGDFAGTYWGIGTHVRDYGLATAGRTDLLNTLGRDAAPFALIPTRLESMGDDLQERLINWGYVVCDAALRRYWTPGLHGVTVEDPAGFPYPQGY